MKYEITQTITKEDSKQDSVTLTLESENGGSFEIRSYGMTMDFKHFVEFADAVHEIRQKFAVINSKFETENGPDKA